MGFSQGMAIICGRMVANMRANIRIMSRKASEVIHTQMDQDMKVIGRMVYSTEEVKLSTPKATKAGVSGKKGQRRNA